MSKYEQKNGDVAIFKNSDKSGQQPDYRGNLTTPSGEKLEIALWISESEKGTKYFSGKVQEPYKKEETQPTEKDEVADDLPF
jgi:uncharacterized protein (DUF736 family)